MAVTVTEKICTICTRAKKTDEFYANKYRKDGFGNICKLCDRERSKQPRVGIIRRPPAKTFTAEMVAKVRKLMGLSVMDFAHLLGFDRATIAHIEAGSFNAGREFNECMEIVLEREGIDYEAISTVVTAHN